MRQDAIPSNFARDGHTRAGGGEPFPMPSDEFHLQDVFEKLQVYQGYARLRDRAHYEMWLRLNRRERLLGIPVIILSTIVGTAIFASLQEQAAVAWQIATGMLSVTAAVLAALQTFFGFRTEAERHAAVAAGYAQLRRRFDTFRLRHRDGHSTREEGLAEWEELVKQLDELEQKAPRIPTRLWNQQKKELITQ
jgi:hypothetical protein